MPMKTQEQTCENCGIVFLPRNHGAIPKFCSRKCYNKRRSAMTCACENCGIEIRMMQRYRPRRFCTPKCRWDWEREKLRTLRPHYPCQQCGTLFARRKKRAKYCSRECVHASQERHFTFTCAGCGAESTTISHNKTRRKYCSRECYDTRRRRPVVIEMAANYRIRGFVLTMQRKDGNLCCEKCGDKNLHHLTVHHRDGNNANHIDENLETLCANCHFEIHWIESSARKRTIESAIKSFQLFSVPATRHLARTATLAPDLYTHIPKRLSDLE